MYRVERTLTVGTGDGPMELYEVVPEAASGTAVIVVQEAFGLNDHIRDVTRRFAGVGYHAAAPGLFHRAGGGTAPYDDFSQVLPLFDGLDDEAILVDVDATIAHLQAAGSDEDQIGLVGFCFGGRVAFLVAARRRVGATVSFYGGGIVESRRSQFPALIEDADKLRSPWLGLFGDRDDHVPVRDVERLAAAVAESPVPTKVVRYPSAEHGFFCDERDSYDEEAARDGWRRTLEWFDSHLGSV